MSIRRAKRLTLKEVALKIGVSTATVSNAFNRPSQLSQELREEILQSCKEMGYAGPHAESRQLRTGKTKVIGVMLSHQLSYSFSDPVANMVLQGISQVFEKPEYNILVVPSRRELKSLSGLESFVEGFIIYGPPSQDRLRELIYHRKAIIAIDFTLENAVSININNQKAARECAEFAFSHHPEHTVILGLRMAQENRTANLENLTLYDPANNIMVQRLLGFQEAALASNKVISKSHIWNIPDNTHFLAYETAKYVLQQTPRPNVLLCMSDRIALSAIQAAHDLGLKVPNDVMITGYDGIDEARTSTPSVTTIEQPSLEKGRAAAEIFLGDREEENLTLHAPLVIRDSCPNPN
ncbi:LacI family DNA-binding transcriptional regulator [Glaciecola siphonariae]|uniref:LacI family DNA-binding transcriptional regulator n=1 Tax=Glaciecola siphonariae TaxID=521012 RepID=A0ABV9M1H2_9ALTE